MKVKSKVNQPKQKAGKRAGRSRRRRQNRRTGPSGGGRGPAGDNINTLLPTSVNNKATMPKRMQDYRPFGCEAIRTIQVAPDTAPGTIVFDERISHEMVARLRILAAAFQRILWVKVVLKLVTLNGSLVNSGYTAGFIEDPEVTMPIDKKDTVQFLTALRGSSIRQNWVSSNVGQVVSISNLPEMYTTKGVDPRRFYIGRYVVVLNGSPGTENTTFQVMLEYTVDFKVPLAKSLDVDAASFTFPASVFPGSIKVTGALTNEIDKVDIIYAGVLPAPGVYSVPNSIMWLKTNVVNFGWNEDDAEDNKLGYKAWPADIVQNSTLTRLAYLVVPTGALTMADCGYRTTLNGPTVLFKSLTIPTAVVASTADADENSGVDLTISDASPSWWTPPISRDNIQFANGNGLTPLSFASIAANQSTPIILAGTNITQVAPPPTTTELELLDLKYKLHNLSISKAL